MMDSGEICERRGCERQSVGVPAIALVRAKPTILLGQVQDISMDGLSFTYIHSTLLLQETAELDIFLPQEKYHLNGLSFVTVSDTMVPRENPFSTVRMCRRGVRFVGVSPRQRHELANLIQMIGSGCRQVVSSYGSYKEMVYTASV